MMNVFHRILKIARDDGILSLLRKGSLAVIFLLVIRVGAYLSSSSHDELLLFGEQQGTTYSGNSKHLYEWILKQSPEGISAVWMTRNKDIYDELTSNDRPVAYIESLEAIWLAFRARALCFTHSTRDVIPVHTYPSQTLNVHLGHGHPVKYKRKPGPVSKYAEKAAGIDLFVVESEFLKDVHQRRFPAPISDDKYVITGYPRNDALFDPTTDTRSRWERYTASKPFDIEQTILYAPTQRQPTETTHTTTVELFPFKDFRIGALEELLTETKSLLLIKLHPADYQRLAKGVHYPTRHEHDNLGTFLKRLSAIQRVEIINLNHEFRDSNELLPFVDVLVTDYSSIYHDFVLLDRPLVFVPYDYDAFDADFGFGYDYFAHLPGPAISSFNEFESAIEDLSSIEANHQQLRRTTRNVLHTFTDPHSSQRIFDEIQRQI